MHVKFEKGVYINVEFNAYYFCVELLKKLAVVPFAEGN